MAVATTRTALRSSPTINSSPSSHTIIFHPEESVSAAGVAAPAAAAAAAAAAAFSQAAPVPEGEVVIATLGPGDFFGETGLPEGRQMRAASVLCRSDVEVMAMDKEIFKQVQSKAARTANKISLRRPCGRVRRAQRARLTKYSR